MSGVSGFVAGISGDRGEQVLNEAASGEVDRIEELVSPIFRDIAQEGAELLPPLSLISREDRSKALVKAILAWESKKFTQLLASGPIFYRDLCAVLEFVINKRGRKDIIEKILAKFTQQLAAGDPISELFRAKALRFAAGYGDLDLVNLLLAIGSISEEDRGKTVQHAAAGRQEYIIAQLLANGSISEKDRGRAVQHAAEKGEASIITQLLANGLISEKDRGEAVQLATMAECEEIVVQLLENGSIAEKHRGDAIVHAAKNNLEQAVERLLASGSISERARGESVKAAIKYDHQRMAVRLLASGPISLSALESAIVMATRFQRIGMIPLLLRDANRDFIRVDIGFALIEATQSGRMDVVEALLANVPSITSNVRDSAITNVGGDHREAIRAMLRHVRIDDSQEFSQKIDLRECVSLKELEENPLELLNRIAQGEMPHRFYVMETPQVVDLGGVIKQVVTVLVNALIEKKHIELDGILRLPVLKEGKSEEVLRQFGQFLSKLDRRNESRTDKFLIGVRWSPELFELLRLDEESSTTEIFVRLLEERHNPHDACLIALLKNLEDESTLEQYQVIEMSKNLDQAREDFLEWRNSMERAVRALKSGLTEEFKEKLHRMSPKEFSNQIQGIEASPQAIIAAFKSELPRDPVHVPLFNERVQWLREWILETNKEERKAFLMALTGRNVLKEGMHILIRWGWRANGAVELHTCFNSIDLPAAAELERDNLIAAVRFAIEQEGYNIA